MSGSAFDIFDKDVFAACANGDAVIAGSNNGVGDLHIGGIAEMDSVRVGAFVRGSDGHFRHLDVNTVDQLAMESHSVHQI